ncbi:amidohydrolase family protein [Phenylobacterium sp.]|uniref:amidohydrolase family protein n=1 Tax=Phenylobacterium sp. TaxID=1871053 RepID=UPI002F41567C
MPKDPDVQDEPALEPALPIVDAHHHLWRRDRPLYGYPRDYMAPDLVADAQGHNVVATVYMECHSAYRAGGPEAMRPVGETEFAVASAGRVGATEVCAGIVAYADLMLGEAAGEVLDAHAEAGRGRFRGVRNMVIFTEDPGATAGFRLVPPRRLAEPALRAGARELVRRGLVFDTWLFQSQLAELADFAAALPDLTIVLDHVGGYTAIGGFAERPQETLEAWRRDLAEVARRPNVVMKLGGMGLPTISPSLIAGGGQASSEAMAALWKPLFDTCVDLFGAERCMLESNFPVDGLAGSYRRLWNAFKRLAAGASAAEKTALFSGTAARVYNLPAL